MKKTYLYAIVVLVILTIAVIGFAYFSPVGKMICGRCGCFGDQCTCTPETCSQLGKSCGSWSDSCGGTLSCGNCSSGQTCSNGQCIVITCACGAWTNGACGGSCSSNQRQQTRTCNPVGCSVTSRCVVDSSCVASTCSSIGGACTNTVNCPAANGVHCSSNPLGCAGSTPCCCVPLNTS